MRVEQVNSLDKARQKLNMAGLVADQCQRDPINVVRQFSAQRIYRAVEDTYAAFLYLCPIFKKHNDPIYPEAKPEFERSVLYVRQLVRALEDHPDVNEGMVERADIYVAAIEAILDGMQCDKMTA